METIINNQNGYNRMDYYYQMLEDMRNVFINFGKYLERNNISNEGSILDYENFLVFQEAQEKEFEIKEDTTIKDYFESLSEKEIERMDFDDFLTDAIHWQEDIIIIKNEDWDEFINISEKDNNYDIKLEYTDGVDFYKKFKEITGIGLDEFDKSFVSAKYINEEIDTRMSLIIEINGINQIFIIDKM